MYWTWLWPKHCVFPFLLFSSWHSLPWETLTVLQGIQIRWCLYKLQGIIWLPKKKSEYQGQQSKENKQIRWCHTNPFQTSTYLLTFRNLPNSENQGHPIKRIQIRWCRKKPWTISRIFNFSWPIKIWFFSFFFWTLTFFGCYFLFSIPVSFYFLLFYIFFICILYSFLKI